MNTLVRNLFLACLISISHSCKSQNNMLPTVNQLELQKYAGTWYEIARLPNSFERGLTSVTATYSLKSNGKVNVINQGYKGGTKKKSINGTARVPNKTYPGRLKVQFFWPFSGDYYVIELDDDYQYALVGTPSRKFLWVLSKKIEMPEEIYKEYIEKAAELGFNTGELLLVDQRFNKEQDN